MTGQQTLDVVKEADKSPDNVEATIRHTMQEVGKRIAPENTNPEDVEKVAVERLTSLIERIERLENEKKGVASDISDIYAEAKSAGFDTKIMREIIKLRRMEAAERDECEFLRDTYCLALDM